MPLDRCEVSESFYIACRSFQVGSADCVQCKPCAAVLLGVSTGSPSHYHPSTESSPASSIGCSQLYVKKTSHATSITNKVSNTVAQLKGVPLKTYFPPYSSTIFASPQFPTHPWISIPIDRRSEWLLMANNCCQIWKRRRKRSRRMSFIARHLAMTAAADWRDVMY